MEDSGYRVQNNENRHDRAGDAEALSSLLDRAELSFEEIVKGLGGHIKVRVDPK